MASYTLNKTASANIRELIEARQYVLDSDWDEAAHDLLQVLDTKAGIA